MSFICALAALAALFTLGCSKKSTETPPARMGENLRVGSLIYTVTETHWADQLDETAGARMPSNRFLVVRVSVTNSGGGETIIPAMSLIDANGTVHNELNNGTGLRDWLGMIRRIKPAQSEHGAVLFDVPVNAYTLQVSYDDDNPEHEVIGRINIPLKLDFESAPPTADKVLPAR